LLMSACSSVKNGETAMPAATMETRVESSENLLAPTYTPYPTCTLYPTHTPPPTDTPTPVASAVEPVATVEPTASVATIVPVTVTAPPQEPTATAISTASPTVTPVPQKEMTPTPSAQASAGQAVDLARIEDTDPGPPLTIQVSTVRIQENGTYKLTGTLRNDSADGSNPGEIYGGVGVIATFFTDAPPPNYHGPVEVYAACWLLAPGEECPFSLEIYPRDYVSYHLHPEGTPVEYREPAAVELSGVQVVDTGSNTVRITGTANNANPFKVKNVIVSGVLLDAGDQIVSTGSSFGLKEDVEPGASVRFDLRLEKEPYTSYQLYAQAERDWD